MYKVKLDGYVLYHADHPSAMLTDPVLELEPGYAGVFTATVPPDNPLYDRICCRKSMVSVFRNNREIFYGEVRKFPNIDRYRNKQIYCTGALSFLADSIQPQAEYHDISPAALLGRMLEIHNSQVEPRKQIKLGYVSITDPNNSLYRCTNYENTLEAIREKLVNRLGGYLRLRHVGDQLILDWVSIEQYGSYSTQPIEFGLNLLDYSETTSAEDVVTALIPLGATLEGESEIEALEKRVDITSVNDGKNYVFSQDAVDQFGWVWATNTWDDVTVPANLKAKAEEWLSSTQFETMSLTLTAADLSELGHDYDAFAEGDRIHCLAKPYGMDIVLPVMKLTIPLQNPAGRTLELSSKQQKTYTSQQSAVRNQLRSEQNDAISISNRNIQISIDNLTAMMTGAKGGYKLTEYDEDGRWLRDLYMDTPEKTTAKRVMQINKDGIAASTTGYEGPYTVGITVDGQILGSWIAANSIDTNQLSIGLNNWIKGTDDGIASKVEKDGIISAINQSSEEVAIQAQRINLNGAITANNYFKIKTDGSMEAIAGQIGGFNINSDYIAFGDWTHAINWLSMCTPHGGAGDVYLGKGGISTDSFDGQSGSIVRSIKMTEGTIGFYKGAYECGFVGVSDGNEIKMSLMDKEKNDSYYSDLIQNHDDWLYVGVYADEAKTGTKESRADFQRLIADCHAGKIDMVITKSISRFARNTVTLLQTVRDFKAWEVDIFFEEQNIHTMSSDGELMMTILASYAQEESRSASENQKWRIKRNFEEGMPWNGAMLGYRLKNGRYEIIPEEADIVRRIYDEYLSGDGYLTIAKRLNEDGIPSRFGKQWGQSVISKILSNYTYTGNLILQKTFRENHITKKTIVNNGELPKYHAEDAHDAIIDMETFQAVQAEKSRRAARFIKKPTPKKTYPFTSLLVCEGCGKNYRRKVTKTGPVWVCGTFNSMGKAACASKQIPEETLQAVTAEVLGQMNFPEELLRRLIKNILVCDENVLIFRFYDGSEVTRKWKDRSRSQSWTDEMKAAARQKALERRNQNA